MRVIRSLQLKHGKGASYSTFILGIYIDKLDKNRAFFALKKVLLCLDSRGLHKQNIVFKRP